MSAELKPCTTPAAKKRHLSDCLSDLPGSYKGMVRRNATLCGLAGAMGQAELDSRYEQRRVPLCRRTPIADLSECESCQKVVAKIGAARSRNARTEVAQ